MPRANGLRAIGRECVTEEALSTFAHELRAPLNAISGWAELLEEGSLSPEETRRAIATIRRSVAAQSRLIEDLFEGCQWGNDGLSMTPRSVEIDEVVSGVVVIVQPFALRHGVELETRLPPARLHIWGDVQRLQQVICNLLGNAVKFSTKGSTVELRVERLVSRIALRVRDYGIGISRDFLPHVFERFRRGNHGRRGLGLGLAIAHQIVERHGGSIQADSDGEGCGATFTVELPLDQSARR
jgi:signal transduction histidine kinase